MLSIFASFYKAVDPVPVGAAGTGFWHGVLHLQENYVAIILNERRNDQEDLNMAKITKTFQNWCEEQGTHILLQCYEAADNLVPAAKIGFSSTATVGFRCAVCGYEWSRTLNKATRKGGRRDCPSCNGRLPLRTTLVKDYPELLAQWDFEKNGRPEDCKFSKESSQHVKAHWFCKRCRNKWEASIYDRVRSAERVRRRGGELCPFCAHEKVSPIYNLAVVYPEVAGQWDYERNGALRPEQCFPAGGQKVWWKCDFDPSHRWQDVIGNRTVLRRGCPRCAKLFKMTYTSRVLFYYLRQAFPDCVCEMSEGRYHLDICLPDERIVIEHHGYTHQREATRERDERRRRELLDKGYRHVLWLVESEEPLEEYIREGDVLTYYDPAPHYHMDKLVCYLLDWLETLTDMPVHYQPPDYVRDHYSIERTYYHERKKRSLAAVRPDLAEEWSEKNSSPADAVMAGSNQKAIWKCRNCQQEFLAHVANRTKHDSGCPHCWRMRFQKKMS